MRPDTHTDPVQATDPVTDPAKTGSEPALHPGELHIELDVPDAKAVAEALATWGFRSLFEYEDPEFCIGLTDGFFTWTLIERQTPPQLCLHYFTMSLEDWFDECSQAVRKYVHREADPDWGVSIEMSTGVHVHVQGNLPEIETRHPGASLLPRSRFAEIAIGTEHLDQLVSNWTQLGFRELHRSGAGEPLHALLADDMMLIGLYGEAPWEGPALAFFSRDVAGRIAAAKAFCGEGEQLSGGAVKVLLPGGFPVLWLPDNREVPDEVQV